MSKTTINTNTMHYHEINLGSMFTRIFLVNVRVFLQIKKLYITERGDLKLRVTNVNTNCTY